MAPLLPFVFIKYSKNKFNDILIGSKFYIQYIFNHKILIRFKCQMALNTLLKIIFCIYVTGIFIIYIWELAFYLK